MSLAKQRYTIRVAPLAGSVDRNVEDVSIHPRLLAVAPLAGSVDRNGASMPQNRSAGVAPLAGSVDRNDALENGGRMPQTSLPSRGAWIEIALSGVIEFAGFVAPLAGSVDRNPIVPLKNGELGVAPLAGSVDRNERGYEEALKRLVAPLAGSVDRNTTPSAYSTRYWSRSPRGERG